ncbi:hypothetical protein EDB19DRAFT_1750564 [Suillus lakei]|nr:hypothetical protein EDB19DRAFT_1750564 [Suillus lakei]
MFPRLLSLSASQDTTRYLHLFLSPILRCCILPVNHSDPKVVVTRCAALEDSSLDPYLSSTAYESTLLSETIISCKRLVTLFYPFDWAVWKHLSDIPTLLKIAITWGIESRVPSPPNSAKLNFAPFLNLSALSFRTNTAAYITTVIQHSEFPFWKKIVILVDSLPWIDAERLFRGAKHARPLNTLACSAKVHTSRTHRTTL